MPGQAIGPTFPEEKQTIWEARQITIVKQAGMYKIGSWVTQGDLNIDEKIHVVCESIVKQLNSPDPEL